MGLAVLGLAAGVGAQPVADAAKAVDWATVRALVEQGADVTTPQGDGTTALHWAGYWGEDRMAETLLRHGADANATTDLGVTPLWTACENGSAQMTRILLETGADPNAALMSGETLLMTAARSASAAVVEQLLAAGADVNAAEQGRGQTELMWAVARRRPAVVEALLAHQPDLHARSDVRTEVVKTSLEPWNPDYIIDLPQGGYTPLLFAARVGDLHSARLLVAAVNETAPYGTSAAVVAAHSGHGELAAFLIEQGADPNVRVARSTPVRRDSVDYYLHPSYVGATPFWLAARFSAPAIMRLLAEHGADPLIAHRPVYWEGRLAESARPGRGA